MTIQQGETARVEVIAAASGDPIDRLRVFVDDVLVKDIAGHESEVELAPGTYRVIAVAQAAKSDSGAGVWQSKGWRAWTLVVKAQPKMNLDGDTPQDDGCSASRTGHRGRVPMWLLALAVIALAGVRLPRATVDNVDMGQTGS